MRVFVAALLYLALGLGANPALADTKAAEALRHGEMKKLIFIPKPRPVSAVPFVNEDGSEGTLAQFQGKYVLLNLWATWCAPCRKEMPYLAELQSELGGETFEVVTIATGRSRPDAIDRFLDEIGVDTLPRHRDDTGALARDMVVLGLPVSVLIDPEGNEIARLLGDANWASDNAKDILRTLIAPAEGS